MRGNNSLQVTDDMSSMLLQHDDCNSSKYQSISLNENLFNNDDPITLRKFYYYNIYKANLNASLLSNERRQRLQKYEFTVFANSARLEGIEIYSSSTSIAATSPEISRTSRLRKLPESSEEIRTYFYGYMEKAKVDAIYFSKKSRQAILLAV